MPEQNDVRRKLWPYLLLALLVIVIDQLTKVAVLELSLIHI